MADVISPWQDWCQEVEMAKDHWSQLLNMEQTSDILTNKLNECKSVCKQFANITEYINIISNNQQQYHYGFEVSKIKELFKNNTVLFEFASFFLLYVCLVILI